MTAIILGWNPDRWNDWNYANVVAHVGAAGLYLQPWGIGPHLGVSAGTEAWLFLQGHQGSGLLGHGVVVSQQPISRTPPAGGPGAVAGAPG